VSTSAHSNPGDVDRSTLLFMHIPKTAGTALRFALQSVYEPAEWAAIYEGAPEGRMTREEFGQLPSEAKRPLAMVFGHFRYGIHELLPQPSQYVTVLRDPIDRVASLYDMYRITQPHWIEGMTLGEWAASGRSLQSNNEMVRYVSGRDGVLFGSCPPDMLEEAFANISERFAGVLTTDSLDQVELERITGRSLPPLERIGAGERSVISPQDRRTLAELNELDVALYRFFASARDQAARRLP
jgi:hypothetical protein